MYLIYNLHIEGKTADHVVKFIHLVTKLCPRYVCLRLALYMSRDKGWCLIYLSMICAIYIQKKKKKIIDHDGRS